MCVLQMAGHEDHSHHIYAHREPSVTNNLTDFTTNYTAFDITTPAPVSTNTNFDATTTAQHLAHEHFNHHHAVVESGSTGSYSDLHTHNDHNMKMYFHGGCTEVILFDWWRIDSCFGLLLSCIVIFFMAAAYEGIKWFRVYFQMWSSSQPTGQRPLPVSLKDLKNRSVEDALIQKGDASNGGDNGGLVSADQVYAPTVTPGNNQQHAISRRMFDFLNSTVSRSSPLVSSRFIEACLYCLQLTIAYWLMLIIMTYNVYLTGAVVVGAAFGYWLFAGFLSVSPIPTNASVDQSASDACH